MCISLALFQAREPISLRRMNQGECGPQVMVGLIPLLRPGCFGGQSLPDRPSLVIPKTPVSRPYHGLIQYDAAIRPDLITGCAQDLQAYFRPRYEKDISAVSPDLSSLYNRVALP